MCKLKDKGGMGFRELELLIFLSLPNKDGEF